MWELAGRARLVGLAKWSGDSGLCDIGAGGGIPTKSHASPCSLKLSRSAVLILRLNSPAQHINVTFVTTVYNERHVNILILHPVKQLPMLVFITNSDSRSYSD